jgi:5-deoxy-glucuronate isomerase
MRVTPQSAGWELLHFAARKLSAGRTWTWDTGENELALVTLGGALRVRSSRGEWQRIGRRADVFSGMPCCLYLPRRTQFEVQALDTTADFAYGWCATDQDHPARLVTPGEVEIEIRGGGNATRQINKMIPPGFDCHRLVVVEVYTPSGNWSSYPPHKHDVHRVGADGSLLEADLEEVYFYKIERPAGRAGGYAYQRIYTPAVDGKRKIDELLRVEDSQLVLSPEGYHPVVAAHGYNCYYLNMLAGSAQSLAAEDDPEYTWVKSTWTFRDPRLPMVGREMEQPE